MADPGIPVKSLFANPDSYKGEIVILGGTIASVKNMGDGTYVEVVNKPLDNRGRPEHSDQSHGRFIIFHDGFLDTAIYSKGRHLTVAGEVLGKKLQALGEITYSYLFIKNMELHLVEPGTGLPIHIGIGVSGSF